MRGEEPPLEDLAGPGASEPPPWDDAAGPASAAARPQRTARPMTASAVRTSAPLLATAAAQARYLPRDQAATSAKPVTAAVVAVSGDATAAVARPDRPAMVRSNAQINPVPDLAVTASAPAARPTSLARQVVEPLAEVPADPLTDGWIALLQPLLERQLLTGFARELGWQAQCVGLALADEPRRIVLRVERESLRQGAHRERLQAALAEQLGAAVALEVEAGPVADSAARRDAAAKARAQRQAEAVIRDDPLVQSLLARFPGAQLVPGSIRPVSL
jgi:DNA polymerase-3 subunit gamma/tau